MPYKTATGDYQRFVPSAQDIEFAEDALQTKYEIESAISTLERNSFEMLTIGYLVSFFVLFVTTLFYLLNRAKSDYKLVNPLLQRKRVRTLVMISVISSIGAIVLQLNWSALMWPLAVVFWLVLPVGLGQSLTLLFCQTPKNIKSLVYPALLLLLLEWQKSPQRSRHLLYSQLGLLLSFIVLFCATLVFERRKSRCV